METTRMSTSMGSRNGHANINEHFFMEVTSGVCVRHTRVTPEMAAEWLKLNSTNRRVEPKRVAFLAQQIVDKNWVVTHQGIAFWDDGTLADGQHRLMAIVKAGVAVDILVARGLRKPAIHAIDIGRPRSTRDVLNFVGARVTSQTVSCAKVLYYQRLMVKSGHSVWWNNPIPTETFATFVSLVSPAIDFAFLAKKAKGIGHSCVQAAVASAWFTEDREKIARFKYLLVNGVDAATDESAAIRLRDFLITTHLTAGGSSERQQLFLRTCTALRAFLEGRGLSKLYCRADAAFPIPDDGDL
jgi:hypothetical protein